MGTLFGGVLAWLTAQAAFGIRSIGLPPAAISLIVGYIFVAIGCCLLFLGCLGIPRQWLPKSLVYLGKISYGMYVFHLLAIACARRALGPIGSISFASISTAFGTAGRFLLLLAAALAVTILLAMASYRFLEQPFLKMKERFTFVRSRRS